MNRPIMGTRTFVAADLPLLEQEALKGLMEIAWHARLKR